MKQFISKAKNLSQKAAEIKAAMQQLPPKVAEIREAVASTTGQLQQLRTEVQSSVAALKADNEARIIQVLQELNASLDVFLEAGYELNGVDMEISPVHRLMVRLRKLEDVHPSVIRSLVSANPHRSTTNAILEALLQARQVTDKVQLTRLNYCELVVHVGPIPSVRLCWRAEEEKPEPEAADKLAVPSPAPAAPPSSSSFGQSSFFERRTPQASAPAAEETSPPTPSPRARVTISTPAAATPNKPPATPEPKPAASPPTAWTSDALVRFKQMPDLSKHKR